MYLPDHEKMAQSVARRFLLGAVNRVAAFNMDMFARLSVLEGAAGVKPGTWLRRGARGFDAALEHFGPYLAGAWSTTTSQGVYDAALASAAKVLSGVPDMDAEDLLQKLVARSAKSGGNDRERIFYAIGKKLAPLEDKLQAGKLLPRDSRVISTAAAWTRRSAIDALRSHNTRKMVPMEPSTIQQQAPTQELDSDQREALLLLALQSPGGPGREVRQIIDRLIGQSFPKSEAPIVRVFLQKISNPKYRSPAAMRKMFKTFSPDRWFGQALKDVRRQMIEEMKISPQRLTNVLGSKASKVFRFLRAKVSKNPTIQKIISDLADEIELLAPAGTRLGTEREYELTERQTPRDHFDILQRWLRETQVPAEGDDEKDANLQSLPVQHIPGSIGDGFERGEYLEWGHQHGPHAVFNRGPVELRLAFRYLQSKFQKQADAQTDFWNWMEQKYPRVRNPNTDPNAKPDISTKTLKDYAGGGEHQQAAQRLIQMYMQQFQQSQQEQGKQPQKPSTQKQDQQRAFDTWIADQDPKVLEQWQQGKPGATKAVLEQYKKHTSRKPLHSIRKEEKAREGRFQDWLKGQGSKAQEAWKGEDRVKRIKVRQQFAQHDKEQAAKSRSEQKSKNDAAKAKKVVPRKKLFSIPKDKKAPKWVDSDNGNRFHTHADVGDQAKISESRVSGTVGGAPTIEKSSIQGSVGDKAEVIGSTIEEGSLVEGDARLKKVHVTGDARVRGNTNVTNARITGGSWDGQQIKDGYGGEFRNAYDQDVLDALTSLQKKGLGDAPLRAMAQYLADGGRTKGWFGIGGDLDRDKLQKKIQKHVYESHDGKNPSLGRGASFISRFDDDQFKTIWKAAQKEAENIKSKREKKGTLEMNQRLLYRLTKAALQDAQLRPELMPLIRMAQDAKVASDELDLRKTLIRVAYESPNPDLRRTLVAIAGSVKVADAPGKKRYHPAFLRFITDRKFQNPDPDGRQQEIVFWTPKGDRGDEWRQKIYEQWWRSRRDLTEGQKPQGLGPETKLDVEDFDKLQVGDVIWRSDSPVKLHRIIEVENEGKRAKNPVMTMVQFDRNAPEKEGEKRRLHRSTLADESLEFHQVPGMGPRAERDKAQKSLPTEPKGGWPKFDGLGLSSGKAETLQQAFKDFKGLKSPTEVTMPKIKSRLEEALGSEPSRKVLKEFMHELRDWVGELKDLAKDGGGPLKDHLQAYQAMKIKLDQGITKLDGDDRGDRKDRRKTKEMLTPDMEQLPDSLKSEWDEDARKKMTPVFTKAIQMAASSGTGFDDHFTKGFLKDLKKAGANMEGARASMAMSALARFCHRKAESTDNLAMASNLKAAASEAGKQAKRLHDELRGKIQEKKDRKEQREKGPKRHENRKELRGGGRKQMDSPAKLNAYFIGLALPENVNDEAKKYVTEQLKKASYADLEKLRRSAASILENFDDPRAKETALVKHLGYDREGLKKLKRLMARKLGDVNGRRYHDDVLDMANKYDLESEDADALYDFRVDKPARGRALSDQEKMNRFLAKAKPETRERMQGMALADFMVMYNSILKEILEEDEELSQAA